MRERILTKRVITSVNIYKYCFKAAGSELQQTSRKQQVAANKSQATGCSKQVASNKLQQTSRKQQVAANKSQATKHRHFTVFYQTSA